mmetsp:Transcript_6760/g.17572  ORF Transcript_6760/g.17572 Transcript_6760/m.17572 type:complete len:161 (+) Transcript_6760:1508-1990(+)
MVLLLQTWLVWLAPRKARRYLVRRIRVVPATTLGLFGFAARSTFSQLPIPTSRRSLPLSLSLFLSSSSSRRPDLTQKLALQRLDVLDIYFSSLVFFSSDAEKRQDHHDTLLPHVIRYPSQMHHKKHRKHLIADAADAAGNHGTSLGNRKDDKHHHKKKTY